MPVKTDFDLHPSRLPMLVPFPIGVIGGVERRFVEAADVSDTLARLQVVLWDILFLYLFLTLGCNFPSLLFHS